MLRNRASSVPRKQAFMAHHHHNYIRSISAFTAKVLFGEKENSEPVSDKNTSSWERLKLESGGIGLAIIDDPVRGIEDRSKPRSAKVLFGPTVGVQIPAPAEGSGFAPAKKRAFTLGEMELSEDYTCVISRGPNPRTIHIFDNCIVESDSRASSENLRTGDGGGDDDDGTARFRRLCDACNENLVRSSEPYVYRGDKVFCSEECCNNQELVIMNGMQSS